MRMAVCFAGMPRHYDKCSDSLLKFFTFNNMEVDFFIHCWSNIWYHPKVGCDTRKELDKDSLGKDLSNIFSPKKMIIEDQLKNSDLEDSINLLCDIHESVKHFTNTPKPMAYVFEQRVVDEFLTSRYHFGQIYSISKAIQIKTQYEKENNFEYDLVFRSRLDNYMQEVNEEWKNSSFENMSQRMSEEHIINDCRNVSTKSELIFCQWLALHGKCVHMGDKFFGGKSSAMSVFENLFNFQMFRIIEHLSGSKNIFQFFPEAVLGDIISTYNYMVEHHLWPGEILTYRDYHVGQGDDFEKLREIYLQHEK